MEKGILSMITEDYLTFSGSCSFMFIQLTVDVETYVDILLY